MSWLRVGAAAAAVTPAGVDRAIVRATGLGLARLPSVAGRLGVGLGGAPEVVAARRRTVAANLIRIVGPDLAGRRLDRMVDASFTAYARYVAESLRLPSLSAAEIDSGMSLRDFGPLHDAIDAGRGAILALPHLGGWEWGGTWLARTGVPVSVVVEDLEARDVFDWWTRVRRGLGFEVIVNGPSAGADCARALRAGRVLCLLSDRAVGGVASVPVELFGGRVEMPAGPAVLGLRTGAPVLPAAVYFAAGDGHLAVVRPPLDLAGARCAARGGAAGGRAAGHRGAGGLRGAVAVATQALAGELEALIRRDPTQWFMWEDPWERAG